MTIYFAYIYLFIKLNYNIHKNKGYYTNKPNDNNNYSFKSI